MAVEDRDLVLLHEKADAVRELLRNLARALHDLLHVEADLLRGEAVVAEMMQEVIDLRGPQQRLRGNAAPVEADAAQVLAFHHRRLHAELRRADRGDVPTRPAAHHDDVEGCLGQIALLRLG